MSFIKSALFGALVGTFFSLFGMVGMIPIIGPLIGMFLGTCICLFTPFIGTLAGYLLCSITKVKKADYGAAGINLVIYSLVGSIIFALINFIMQIFRFWNWCGNWY
jgi:uncharacterized protein YqgC (DUF456 family)